VQETLPSVPTSGGRPVALAVNCHSGGRKPSRATPTACRTRWNVLSPAARKAPPCSSQRAGPLCAH